jgi:hypothetical protein
VIISITPRIVRAPKVTEEDLVPLRVGTQEVPRVEGARPPLFGTEPEAEKVQPAPGAVTPPASGTAPSPSAAPKPAAAPPAAPPVGPTTPPGAPPEAPSAAPEGGAVAPATDARPVAALFSPPEVALRVGQAGGLAVVLVGTKDVQSVEITLAWDPSLAEVTDLAAGSLLTLDGSPVSAERALESGRARVRFSRATGATGSGAVVAVTMKGLKAGSGSVVVESLALSRGSGSERPAPPAPARLVVAP